MWLHCGWLDIWISSLPPNQGILTYFALGRFRRGVQEVAIPTYVEAPLPGHHQTPYPPTYAPPSYNPTTYIPTAYSSYPSSMSDLQPQQPQREGDATYQPPSFWVPVGGERALPDICWGNYYSCTAPRPYHIDMASSISAPNVCVFTRRYIAAPAGEIALVQNVTVDLHAKDTDAHSHLHWARSWRRAAQVFWERPSQVSPCEQTS